MSLCLAVNSCTPSPFSGESQRNEILRLDFICASVKLRPFKTAGLDTRAHVSSFTLGAAHRIFLTMLKSVIAIRSKYYVSELQRRLGVGKVSQILPALVERSHVGSEINYSIFRADLYRYRSGENIKNDLLIKAVENLLPGTARVISHPLWPLLSARAVEENQLIALAQALEPSLASALLKYDELTRAIYFRNFSKDRSWYRPGSKFLRIIDRRSLDDLAALLIAIKLHELHGEYGASRLLREVVRHFFVEISLTAEFECVAEDLYREVHGALAEVPFSGKCDKDVLLMFAQVMTAETPERMLGIIRRVSTDRATHVGEYSEILRCSRTAAYVSGD